jgi:hypothetical protein
MAPVLFKVEKALTHLFQSSASRWLAHAIRLHSIDSVNPSLRGIHLLRGQNRIVADPVIQHMALSIFRSAHARHLFRFHVSRIFLWYCTIFMINLRHHSLIQVGVQFLPLTILGTCAAFIAAWMVPRLPAQAIIGIGCTAILTCSILLATTPIKQTYWAMLFPALITRWT